MPWGNIKNLRFVSRIMVPYGPNLYGEPPLQMAQDRPWQGYGFGMEAVEELTYDRYLRKVCLLYLGEPRTIILTQYLYLYSYVLFLPGIGCNWNFVIQTALLRSSKRKGFRSKSYSFSSSTGILE
jgi:hypothetical protein